MPCWVLLLFFAELLVSLLLDWLTSPLFDPALSTEIGTLTLVCSLEAELSADWLVLLEFDADWLWEPPLGPPPSP